MLYTILSSRALKKTQSVNTVKVCTKVYCIWLSIFQSLSVTEQISPNDSDTQPFYHTGTGSTSLNLVLIQNLVVPPDGTGLLVAHLAIMIKISRLYTSYCYYRLLHMLLSFKPTLTNKAIFKMFIRAFDYYLTSLPSTKTSSEGSDEEAVTALKISGISLCKMFHYMRR